MRQGIPIRSSGLSAGCCKLSGLDLEGSRMRLPSTACIRSSAATVQTRTTRDSRDRLYRLAVM